MLQKGTTITCDDPLYDESCSKLPAQIANLIISSAGMQKKLQPGTPWALADAMEMVGGFCQCTTSRLAITATPVNHDTNFAPPNIYSVAMPIRTEQMDLTVPNADTRCYCCNGFGHKSQDCVTPDTRGRSQAFYTMMGGNRSRWESGHDHTVTCHGGAGTSPGSAAGGMKHVQVAMVKVASMNNAGEDLAARQEVGDEEDGHGNGNWEWWWNVLLPRISLEKRKQCRVKHWGKALHTYGM